MPLLRSRTVAFARPLAPGVGMAEDPGNGASFGQMISDLLTRVDKAVLAVNTAFRKS